MTSRISSISVSNTTSLPLMSVIQGIGIGLATLVLNQIPWSSFFLFTQFIGFRLYKLGRKELCEEIQKTRRMVQTYDGRRKGLRIFYTGRDSKGLYPHLVLVLTSNKKPEFIDCFDTSYLRKGRVDLTFELLTPTPASSQPSSPRYHRRGHGSGKSGSWESPAQWGEWGR